MSSSASRRRRGWGLQDKIGLVPDEEIKDLAKEEFLCQICLGGERDWELLLCDACNGAYHIYCHDPPLPAVPSWSWYCSSCSKYERQRIETPSWRSKSNRQTETSTRSIPGVSEVSTETFSFANNDDSDELTDDNIYAERHQPLESNQRRERIGRTRGTRKSSPKLRDIYTSKRFRTKERKSLGTLPDPWKTPPNLLPQNMPCEVRLVQQVRLSMRDVYIHLLGHDGFAEKEAGSVALHSATNMMIPRPYSDLWTMYVEQISISDEEKLSTIEKSQIVCHVCGSSERSWSLTSCFSCKKAYHQSCLPPSETCNDIPWCCAACGEPPRDVIQIDPTSSFLVLHDLHVEPEIVCKICFSGSPVGLQRCMKCEGGFHLDCRFGKGFDVDHLRKDECVDCARQSRQEVASPHISFRTIPYEDSNCVDSDSGELSSTDDVFYETRHVPFEFAEKAFRQHFSSREAREEALCYQTLLDEIRNSFVPTPSWREAQSDFDSKEEVVEIVTNDEYTLRHLPLEAEQRMSVEKRRQLRVALQLRKKTKEELQSPRISVIKFLLKPRQVQETQPLT